MISPDYVHIHCTSCTNTFAKNLFEGDSIEESNKLLVYFYGQDELLEYTLSCTNCSKKQGLLIVDEKARQNVL